MTSHINKELEARKAFVCNSSALLAIQSRAINEGTELPILATQSGALQIERFENEGRVADLEAQLRVKIHGRGPRLLMIDVPQQAKSSEVITV